MSAAPDLLYSDVEEQLRRSVRSLLEDRADAAAVLQRVETDKPYDDALWQTLAREVGVAALPIPEDHGGAGASWREAAVVAEELGRAVAPVPFLGSAVLATRALLACGATDLLSALAAGESTAVLAIPFSTAPGVFPSVGEGDGTTVTATVTSVADALGADHFLVPVTDGDGPALYLVAAASVTVEPTVSLDLTRPVATVRFASTAGERLASGTAAASALEQALRAGAALLASEQLGIAERCLEMTVAHLTTRYQFGRPIGSFQALKHRLADLWVAITQARAAARYAAACVSDDRADAAVAVAVAQAHCSRVAVTAAEECVQMHGGIGFTWEHPAHLYLKRAKTAAVALGTPDHHRWSLVDLVDLPPAR
jgi:alkylation response protein AidB-like acyl-CoA dehydrogenase